MSSFRAPQVPQQPPRYYTPGQPLGIPNSWRDSQIAQISAYQRQRAEIQQPQIFSIPAPLSPNVPPTPLQVMASTTRWPLEILQPRSFAPQTAPAVTIPPLQLQIPAQQRWAMEWLVENYLSEFTPGQPLGVSNPVQSDQTQALWRVRAEILQPVICAPQPAPSIFVPASQLQSVPANRWALEWIVENYWVEFTPAVALGVPQPRQIDQTSAYFRQRIESIQPGAPGANQSAAPTFVPQSVVILPQPLQWRFEWLIDFLQPEIVPQALVSYVPPQPLQLPTQQSQRAESAIVLQQRITAATALGIPRPRQTDQFAAYFRQHFEIQQPIYYSTKGGFATGFGAPRVIVYESGIRTTYVDGVRVVYVGAQRTA